MKTIKGKGKAPRKAPHLEDVTKGVQCFFEIVQAADELEAFMAKHSSLGGSVSITIADTEVAQEVAQEMIQKIARLQAALRPYRAGVKKIGAARN